MGVKGSRSAKVIPFPPKTTKASEQKWSRPVMQLGFCVVPSLLLWAQARLKLSAAHLAIVMHLADHWWDATRKPYPAKKTLGERLGVTARQAQRYVAQLEEMGLVRRIERTAPNRGKLTNQYDLSGLVARLKELEPEFRAVKEEAKAKRRAVARPGLRRRMAAAEE